MSESQPIATAPPDGKFLVYGPISNAVDGPNYSRLDEWSEPDWHISCAQWLSEDGSRRVFMTTELDGWGENHLQCWATLWAPLPALTPSPGEME